VFTLVEPEGWLIEIGVQVDGINADVGSLEGPLQQGPKVLDAVGVDVAIDERNGWSIVC
jgi:hypothetical protein